jgi:methionyl-tRNA formyltransferase
MFSISNLKNVLLIGSATNISTIYKIVQDQGLKVGVVTSPDQEVEIKGKCPYSVFPKLDDSFHNFVLSNYPPENTLFVSLGARWIFKKDVIKLMGNNLVNFHGSRLPFDAGGGGFSWRILKKDRIDNQLVHLIDEGIDTGPIITSSTSVFPPNCVTPSDFEYYHRSKFQVFFRDFLIDLVKGVKFPLKNQVDYLGCYNPRLMTDENGWIDWEWNGEQIVDFINAFDDPYNGASTIINKERVRLKKCQLHGGEQGSHPFLTGIIFRKHSDFIVVSTGGRYSIVIEDVLGENGINIVDKLKVGDRFYTKNQDIYKSRTTRVNYGPNGCI